MPTLIKLRDGAFSAGEDTFAPPGGDPPEPGSDRFVTLAEWLAGEAAASGAGRVGLFLAPEDEVEALDGRLDGVAVVALAFPKFRDGRPFTSARLLRERLGFRGEVRAVGDVLRDQAGFMVRCGFDAFVPADGSGPAEWAAAANRHRHVYQRSADGRTPAFIERVKG